MSKRLKAGIVALLVALGLLVAAEPASATTYFNCANGVACLWVNDNGGGSKLTISVGNSGYNTCWAISGPLYAAASSASADFGGGWDLIFFRNNHCDRLGFFEYRYVESSRFENYGGTPYNDMSRSYMIVQS